MTRAGKREEEERGDRGTKRRDSERIDFGGDGKRRREERAAKEKETEAETPVRPPRPPSVEIPGYAEGAPAQQVSRVGAGDVLS